MSSFVSFTFTSDPLQYLCSTLESLSKYSQNFTTPHNFDTHSESLQHLPQRYTHLPQHYTHLPQRERTDVTGDWVQSSVRVLVVQDHVSLDTLRPLEVHTVRQLELVA